METKCGRFDKVIQYLPDSRHDFAILPDDVYAAPIKIEGPIFSLAMVTKLKKNLCCLYSGIYFTVLGSDFVDFLTLDDFHVIL